MGKLLKLNISGNVTAPKDAMRKHHKTWNVVQSGHCTVVFLYLAAAIGRQHHGTMIGKIFRGF